MAKPCPKNPLWKQIKPKQDNEMVLKKLEEWWSMWLNIWECCCYADISYNTYESIMKNKPELLKRKEVLQNNIQMRSKMIISKYMSWSNKLRLWDKEVDISDNMIKANQRRLERKSKSEFSLKTETELTWQDGWPIQIFIPDNKR